MKQIILINPHSSVDIITNSSSELFILNADTTAETIKNYVKQLLNKYGYTQSVEEVIQEPYLITKDNLRKFVTDFQHYLECGAPDYWKIDVELFGEWRDRVNETKQQIVEQHNKLDGIFKERTDKWFKESEKSLQDKYVGKWVVESKYTNTIPWDLFDDINSTFNGRNLHLG